MVPMNSPSFSDERLIRKLLPTRGSRIVYHTRPDLSNGIPLRLDREQNCKRAVPCPICRRRTLCFHSIHQQLPRLIDVQPVRPFDVNILAPVMEYLRIPRDIVNARII